MDDDAAKSKKKKYKKICDLCILSGFGILILSFYFIGTAIESSTGKDVGAGFGFLMIAGIIVFGGGLGMLLCYLVAKRNIGGEQAMRLLIDEDDENT